MLRSSWRSAGQADEKRQHAEQAEQGEQAEGFHPAAAGDQVTCQGDAQHKSQGPAKLGQRQDAAALLVVDAVSQVGLHAGIEDIFADGGQDQGQDEDREGREEDHQGGAGREETQPEQHAELAPAQVGERGCERSQAAEDRAGGQRQRHAVNIHAQAAPEDGQKGIDHPVG